MKYHFKVCIIKEEIDSKNKHILTEPFCPTSENYVLEHKYPSSITYKVISLFQRPPLEEMQDIRFRAPGFVMYTLFYFVEVQLIYNVVLITAVQQSDLVVHTYIFLHILFHYGLSQDVEYSSLWYKVGPCCLMHFIYTSLHLLIPNFQSIPLPPPPPWQPLVSSLCP